VRTTVQVAARLQTAAAAPPARVRLSLLGSFDLQVNGSSVAVTPNGQRVLAFLALQGPALLRSYVAGSLWLDSSDDHAAGSLRSALWRLNRRGQRLVETADERLRLADGLHVDVTGALAQARELLEPDGVECPRPSEVLLNGDLLPDWYDDWVAVERERLRQLRMHALERLSERLAAVHRFGEAVEAALTAIESEPLRESAHRALMRVHIAEGNRSEALSHYHAFRRMLDDELGLAPSELMDTLVAAITQR
jgi:DNA-binding SARP family transcriptional activator